MRKYYKLLAMLLICVLLTGCSSGSGSGSSSNSPFKREHENENDVIKFYNLEWLADVETVKQAFVKDYGENSFYMSNPAMYFAPYSERAGTFTSRIRNNDEEQPLNWEIGGGKVKYISLDFINNPNVIANQAEYNQLYLYCAKYEFEADYNTAEAMKSKLDELYGNCVKGKWDIADINYVWKDSNGNTIEIYYYKGEHYKFNDKWYDNPASLHLTYRCGDIYNYIEQEKTVYQDEKQKEDAKNDKL